MSTAKELRVKWAEALLSGKYNQARGYLRDASGYCCLGVYCEMRDPGGWIGESRIHRLGDFNFLGGDTLKSLRLTDSDQHELASLNDNGAQFPEIAHLILNLPYE